MKKIFALVLSLIVFTSCSSNKYKINQIKIGQLYFDGEIITFYHEQIMHNQILTGSSFYYQTESSNQKTDGILFSKDGSLKLFVDFEGNQEVLDESGKVVEPDESIPYETYTTKIYVLKTEQVHDVRFIEMDDMGCTLISETAAVSVDLNLDLLKLQVESWLRLEDCTEYTSPGKFDLFLEIVKNRREMGDPIRVWEFGKVELEDGRWCVFIREDEREYYLLEIEQVELLNNLVSK